MSASQFGQRPSQPSVSSGSQVEESLWRPALSIMPGLMVENPPTSSPDSLQRYAGDLRGRQGQRHTKVRANGTMPRRLLHARAGDGFSRASAADLRRCYSRLLSHVGHEPPLVP